MSWANHSCLLRAAYSTWQPWWVSPKSKRHSFNVWDSGERDCWHQSFDTVYRCVLLMLWHFCTNLRIRRLQNYELCRSSTESLQEKRHLSTRMGTWQRKGYVH